MSSVSSLDRGEYESKDDARSKGTPSSRRVQRSTVYDAVAGRLTSDRFIRSKDFIPSTRDTTSSSHVALPPGEALFRSAGAPAYYLENIYEQDRNLSTQNPLPTSDLLKAIHSYSSDFYSRTAGEQADSDYQSLDGSALLALGILLEESCNVILGETGDLALLEEKPAIEEIEGLSQDWDQSQQELEDEVEPPAKKRKV